MTRAGDMNVALAANELRTPISEGFLGRLALYHMTHDFQRFDDRIRRSRLKGDLGGPKSRATAARQRPIEDSDGKAACEPRA